jgi:hypothetical protein
MQSDTWRNELSDDSNFSQKTTYSYEKLMKNLDDVNIDLNNLRPFSFLATIYEFTRAFKQLGSSISMAFSDITEKVDIWRNLLKTEYPEATTLQEVMTKEIEHGLQKLNGDNNSSLGHKKKTKYHSYTSGCRTMVRLSWFLHYMITVLKKMANTDLPFNKCLDKSYDEILAPHHTWLVKKAAGVAFGLAPSKRLVAYKVLVGKFMSIFY